ncbi:MAG: putative phosphate transporter permease protein, partial [Actinomycetia bacterium]|nr:putative phosphate transporter permease protein [Actinomycetes bacterium]
MTLVESPPAPPARRVATRFRPGGTSRSDVASLIGAAAAALALVWIIYTRILPFSGALGFAVCWYAAFLMLYALIVVHEHGRLAVADRLLSVLVHSAGALVVSVLAFILGYTAWRGSTAIRWNFLTQTMDLTGPLDPLTSGGALHAIVGSLIQLGVAMVISVPLGITTALFLVEVGGRLARPVRLIVDTMSALPSVVAGLFVLAAFILTFGLQKSGLAASLAISVMMIPIVTRASEVVLRLVPGGLREAAYALGATQWSVVRRVVLPTARSGLATGVVLAMARGVGETAPVLLTSGFARGMNTDPTSGPMISLPLYIYTYVKYPQPTMVARAYAAALVLAVLVLVLFTIARLLGGTAPG